MKSISVQELKALRDTGATVTVIDVREPYEHEIGSLGGTLIPMAEVLENVDRIPRDHQVVLHCKSGKRSAAVIDSLERIEGFTNLYNLDGGYLAWAANIDTSLPQY